jgi:hypothetical protein
VVGGQYLRQDAEESKGYKGYSTNEKAGIYLDIYPAAVLGQALPLSHHGMTDTQQAI